MLQQAWARRRVVWLSGVRRAGKTVLVQSLPDTEHFDCERPRVRRLLEDPEGFLDSVRGTRRVHCWRRKGGHEVDFVLVGRGRPPVAIECKWSAADLDWRGLEAFLADCPKATAYMVVADSLKPVRRESGKAAATVLGLPELIRRLRSG
jgi:predicted AAA+ superfamily ATPase